MVADALQEPAESVWLPHFHHLQRQMKRTLLSGTDNADEPRCCAVRPRFPMGGWCRHYFVPEVRKHGSCGRTLFQSTPSPANFLSHAELHFLRGAEGLGAEREAGN